METEAFSCGKGGSPENCLERLLDSSDIALTGKDFMEYYERDLEPHGYNKSIIDDFIRNLEYRGNVALIGDIIREGHSCYGKRPNTRLFYLRREQLQKWREVNCWKSQNGYKIKA
jgi:hypothetical protein